MHLTQDTWNPSRVELGTYIALFCVNLLVVFRVLHWLPALAATVAGVLLLPEQSCWRRRITPCC